MGRSPGFRSLSAKRLGGVRIQPRCESSTLAVSQCSHGHSRAVLGLRQCLLSQGFSAACLGSFEAQVVVSAFPE